MDNPYVCEYCGQVLAGPDTVCNCPEAKEERERQMKIDSAKSRIYQLLGTGAEDYGFKTVENPNIIGIMERAVELIAAYEIRGITIGVGGGTKAKLAAGANGKITVERSQAQKYKLEE